MHLPNDQIQQILQQVQSGEMDLEKARQKLKQLPFENLGFALVDHHRTLRKNFPEVIFCQGKTSEQIAQIFAALAKKNPIVLATRASEQDFAAVQQVIETAEYFPLAHIIRFSKDQPSADFGRILIISAGTADLPVAEEAAITAETMGNQVKKLYDAGVAGLHRLLSHLELLDWAEVIITVAGMEGALPSVVSGLTDRPVIAVPTSIGYGSSFQGLSALLGMLNSCASGLSVVNIDNGFGAAAQAAAITRLLHQKF